MIVVAALRLKGAVMAWPDLIVAAVMAEIFVTSSIQILQQAWTEHQRDAVATLPAPAK
ncbi:MULTISPECIES: hypothetical protein [Methylobacterium]|uniref:Uncharacterized protein n=2 Tax=Methylobacterium TaxID=407 RepID=A0A679J569_9HYPH|nr:MULTISPECIES: hypothetical protein [Methylobacterium]GJD41978.1 hypothetical protein OICFNHDK_4469 [Methylobacterium bullatum]GJE17244.1 hypothetical protein AIGOOFII_1957 [Methylobacterium marchantiae]CAA2104674.1 hypothetical protein MBUL_02817 [Methylobacterium bullatum]